MSGLLIVDDDEPLRRWGERVLRERGYSCDSAGDVAEARELIHNDRYVLALLDVNMPGESGMALLAELRRDHPEIAALMLTGEDRLELAISAIELGAYGYLVKPVSRGELVINVANALLRRRRELDTDGLIRRLQQAVSRSGQELDEALLDLQRSRRMLWASRADTIARLARLVEFHDAQTGHHLQRMSSMCEVLARRLGLGPDECEEIRLASQLHDVGKVAVPDRILFKRGKLTEEELDVMKTHAETGYRMLSGSDSHVVQLGATIAYTHHERFDGRGYPRGLRTAQIPLEGRIAAVADVFDALTSERVYRSALPVASAVEMMHSERGRHFDPELLDEFRAALPEIEAVRRAVAVAEA